MNMFGFHSNSSGLAFRWMFLALGCIRKALFYVLFVISSRMISIYPLQSSREYIHFTIHWNKLGFGFIFSDRKMVIVIGNMIRHQIFDFGHIFGGSHSFFLWCRVNFRSFCSCCFFGATVNRILRIFWDICCLLNIFSCSFHVQWTSAVFCMVSNPCFDYADKL